MSIADLRPWSEMIALGAILAVFWLLSLRRRHVFRFDRVYAVDPEDMWAVSLPRRGGPIWLPHIEGIDFDEGSDIDGTYRFRSGLAMHVANRPDEATGELAQVLRLFRQDGGLVEVWTSYCRIEPHPRGTRLRLVADIDLVGRTEWQHRIARIQRPLTRWLYDANLRTMLTASGAFARYAERHGRRPAEPVSLLGMRLSWPALALAIVALGWWAWQDGLWFAIVLAAGLVLHEAGHVAVMRALGDRTSAFYFVPFLGGVATGRPAGNDASHTLMVFGGPVAGALSALATWWLGEWLGSTFLVGAAMMFAFLNLFNLAPIPMLDGGQITMAVLRPFVSDGVRYWIEVALLAIAAAMSAYIGIYILALIFGAFAAARFAAARSPRRLAGAGTPLTKIQALAALAGLAVLAALLVALMDAIGQTVPFSDALDAINWGPESYRD